MIAIEGFELWMAEIGGQPLVDANLVMGREELSPERLLEGVRAGAGDQDAILVRSLHGLRRLAKRPLKTTPGQRRAEKRKVAILMRADLAGASQSRQHCGCSRPRQPGHEDRPVQGDRVQRGPVGPAFQVADPADHRLQLLVDLHEGEVGRLQLKAGFGRRHVLLRQEKDGQRRDQQSEAEHRLKIAEKGPQRIAIGVRRADDDRAILGRRT